MVCVAMVLFKNSPNVNVSECFLKFKELGCSMVKPSEQCKPYLHCLQKYNQMDDHNDEEGISYYGGIAVGIVGYVLKRFVWRRFL